LAFLFTSLSAILSSSVGIGGRASIGSPNGAIIELTT
jgi:hypothetical protein